MANFALKYQLFNYEYNTHNHNVGKKLAYLNKKRNGEKLLELRNSRRVEAKNEWKAKKRAKQEENKLGFFIRPIKLLQKQKQNPTHLFSA